MLDGIYAVLGQLHEPVFDDKYSADQAIVKATLLQHPRSRTLTVVFLPWHVPDRYVRYLLARIAQLNTSVLTYYFNESLLESDAMQVKNSFEYIALSVSSDIESLEKEKGYQTVNLLGISLGNVALCMVAEKVRRFNSVLMVAPGHSLADSFWHGWRTYRLKRKLASQGMTLQNLEKEWEDLAPSAHVGVFKGHHVHIILARKDRFIPYAYGRQLVNDFLPLKPKVTFAEKPFGHMATIVSFNPEF